MKCVVCGHDSTSSELYLDCAICMGNDGLKPIMTAEKLKCILVQSARRGHIARMGAPIGESSVGDESTGEGE